MREINQIMSTLRTIALIFILGPLAAMLVEPFFESLFDHLEWDTEDFASPFVKFVSGFVMCATENVKVLYLIFGLGLGVWVHYFAQKYLVKQPNAVIAKTSLWDSKSPSQEGSKFKILDADGHHVIPSEKLVFQVRSSRAADGHSISALFFVRNRSKQLMFLLNSSPRSLVFSNGMKGKPGDGTNGAIPAHSDKQVQSGTAYFYNDIVGLKGTAISSIDFGPKKSQIAHRLILEVDFEIKSQIDKPGGVGNLQIEILADRTRYEDIKS